ncbi:hypothetical protein [Streptomyces natalensis]|uniref:hypothetical protein n=1 Tax=Streptomyces natalensis TaxID=68242 RepID=UPI0004AB1185|nr:hypothetical protein [Streptomyces natalensis]
MRTGVGTHRARSVDRAVTLRNLRNDPSLRFSEAGRALLRWLDQNPAERTELGQAVSRVPAHWAGAVAQLIRDNAAAWTECAEALERRADALDGEAGPERESRVG